MDSSRFQTIYRDKKLGSKKSIIPFSTNSKLTKITFNLNGICIFSLCHVLRNRFLKVFFGLCGKELTGIKTWTDPKLYDIYSHTCTNNTNTKLTTNNQPFTIRYFNQYF